MFNASIALITSPDWIFSDIIKTFLPSSLITPCNTDGLNNKIDNATEVLEDNTKINTNNTQRIPFRIDSESTEPIERKQKFPFSEISFHSSGWMKCFQYGVGKYIQENYDISGCKMIGTSAGALVACALCCDISIDQIYNETIQIRKINKNPFLMCHYAKQSIRKFLPNNCVELIKNRLTIVCCGLESNGFVSKKYDNFNTEKDIVQYLNATIHIPIIDGFFPDVVGDDLLYDGVLVDSHPNLSDSTLSSCLKITWDKNCYCGCTKTQNAIFPELEFPLYWIGLPPDVRCLSLLYYHGYYCAKIFFSKNEDIMTDTDIANSQNIILELNDIIEKTKRNYKSTQTYTYLFKSFFLFISCLYFSQYITTFIPKNL